MKTPLLPFQYINGENSCSLTSFAGLPLYTEMAIASGLFTAIEKELQSKIRGWKDLQVIMSLILLNIAGGDCVDDIERFESDRGLSNLILEIDTHGMNRQQRRAYERRWRKGKTRAFPSASVIRRYLEQFHNEEEEKCRKKGIAFIPAHNELLQSLINVQCSLINCAQKNNDSDVATLDQDATLSATHKRTALYCYEKHKAYQPFNTYWAEHGLLLHSEFRDGNVPAGFEQLRVLQESLQRLPLGIKKVFIRSDSAGCQKDILRYSARGDDERFGIIEFAIAIKISQAFKKAVSLVDDAAWNPIYKEVDGMRIKTNQEWAEVCFVPNWAACCKNEPDYRHIAIREKLKKQPELDGIEPIQQELPFPTIHINQAQYKLFGMVTNRTLPGNELINWHRERCGHSEKAHSIEKSDLAGGKFPSNKFGANAAWWQIMVLAFNLNSLMKTLIMPKHMKTKRLKALRFNVISIAGRFIQHARGLFIKVDGKNKTANLFNQIRRGIYQLMNAPPLEAI
ncbi:MAG: IS1380 family transposase [Candidatus Omnitrophota bacterium]|nr:MAG: IS1380 family transposase [Candidatus Omnitrophota bacterium]